MKAVVGLVDEVGLLNVPVRLGGFEIGKADSQAIFKDAAGLDAGQTEGDGVDLDVLRLHIHEVGWLGGQGNDGSIGMNGAALNGSDGIETLQVGNLEIGRA